MGSNSWTRSYERRFDATEFHRQQYCKEKFGYKYGNLLIVKFWKIGCSILKCTEKFSDIKFKGIVKSFHQRNGKTVFFVIAIYQA